MLGLVGVWLVGLWLAVVTLDLGCPHKEGEDTDGQRMVTPNTVAKQPTSNKEAL